MKKLINVLSLIIISVFFITNCSDENSTEPTNNTEELTINERLGEFENQGNLLNDFIKNPNMEEGKDGYWFGGSGASNYAFLYSDEESNSTSHSLQISAQNESGQFAYWAQTIDATELRGKKITVSVAIKLNNVGDDGVSLAIRGDNSNSPSGSAENFVSTQSKIVKTGTSDWHTLEVSLNEVTTDIKSITIYMLLNAASGTVYFDDLSLTSDVAQAPSYTFQNTNFEDGNSYPEFWWSAATKSNLFSIQLVDNIFNSTNHSVKISSENSGENFSFWAQTIRADELIGKSINVDIKIKSENISGEGIAIAIRGDDTIAPRNGAELFSTTQNNVKIDGTFDWTTYSVSSSTIPENIESITIYLIYLRNTSGTVYFDDINLN